MWKIVVLWENLNIWMNEKELLKWFGIVEDGQLSKLSGVLYKWKIFKLGEIYVVM